MVGTNDMNTRKHIPLPQYTANLDNLSQQIRKSGSALILMTILPVYEPYLFTRHDRAFYGAEGHAARKEKVNVAIREVASKHQAALIDLHHIYTAIGHVGTEASSWLQNEKNSGNTDGVHPTPDGYRAIGLTVYGKLQNYDLKGKTIVCFGDSITAGDGSIDGNSYPAYLNQLLSDQ
jgi:lysophospholipase L1-like esterase